MRANVQCYRPTEAKGELNDQWSSDHLLVCSDEISINFPLQRKPQGISEVCAQDTILILKFTGEKSLNLLSDRLPHLDFH